MYHKGSYSEKYHKITKNVNHEIFNPEMKRYDYWNHIKVEKVLTICSDMSKIQIYKRDTKVLFSLQHGWPQWKFQLN